MSNTAPHKIERARWDVLLANMNRRNKQVGTISMFTMTILKSCKSFKNIFFPQPATYFPCFVLHQQKQPTHQKCIAL